MATLGVELAAVERGRVELVLRHDDRFTQQHGFLHAGAVAAVLDSACGYAGVQRHAARGGRADRDLHDQPAGSRGRAGSR